jgi:hypothetical protein
MRRTAQSSVRSRSVPRPVDRNGKLPETLEILGRISLVRPSRRSWVSAPPGQIVNSRSVPLSGRCLTTPTSNSRLAVARTTFSYSANTKHGRRDSGSPAMWANLSVVVWLVVINLRRCWRSHSLAKMLQGPFMSGELPMIGLIPWKAVLAQFCNVSGSEKSAPVTRKEW